MASINQVREVVVGFVQDGDATAFMSEFSKESFSLALSGDAEAVRLVRWIEAKMAEVQTGHLSTQQFREWLRKNVVETAEAASNAANVAINWQDAGNPGVSSVLRSFKNAGAMA